MCNVHYGKAASGGIDNEIIRLRDGSDQPCDQTGRFRVRVNSAITFSVHRFGIPRSRQVARARSGGFCSTNR